MPRWFGTPEVQILPGLPEHYSIDEVQPGWFVVTDLDGDHIYSSLGPVSVETVSGAILKCRLLSILNRRHIHPMQDVMCFPRTTPARYHTHQNRA